MPYEWMTAENSTAATASTKYLREGFGSRHAAIQVAASPDPMSRFILPDSGFRLRPLCPPPKIDGLAATGSDRLWDK
jgi:hypothetical protein